MSARRSLVVTALVSSLVLLAGCDLILPADEGSAESAQVPTDVAELKQVCAKGRGFSGLPAYAADKGTVRRVAHLVSDEQDPDLWVARSSNAPVLPKSVFVDDKGDVRVVDAVLCQERISTTSIGKKCEMKESNSGKPSPVTLYSAKYRLRLRQARTGEVLVDRTVEAVDTKCPFLHLSLNAEDSDKEISSLPDRDVNAVVGPYLRA